MVIGYFPIPNQNISDITTKFKGTTGTSLIVQWLRAPPSNAGNVGLILGQGTKIPHAFRGTKPACSNY